MGAAAALPDVVFWTAIFVKAFFPLLSAVLPLLLVPLPKQKISWYLFSHHVVGTLRLSAALLPSTKGRVVASFFFRLVSVCPRHSGPRHLLFLFCVVFGLPRPRGRPQNYVPAQADFKCCVCFILFFVRGEGRGGRSD
jgi:hypothetical protein